MTARGWAVLGVCILFVSWAGAADSSLSIFRAARTGSDIEKLIQRGTDVNTRDNNGKTALHYAAENGHQQTVQKLIKLGADPNIRDQEGKTAWDLAIRNGHEGTAKALSDFQTGESWELCLDDQHKERPPVEEGIVTLSIGKTGRMFPQYLNELGIKKIQIQFESQGGSEKSFTFVFSGGSLGPDQFEAWVDGRSMGKSPVIDTASHPYGSYRKRFTGTLGSGNKHVLEIASPDEYRNSAIEISSIQMADSLPHGAKPSFEEIPTNSESNDFPSPSLQFRWVAGDSEHEQAEQLSWSSRDRSENPLFVLKEVLLDWKDVWSVEVRNVSSGNDYAVSLIFSDTVRDRFSQLTEAGVGKRLAMVENNQVILAPIVQKKISDDEWVVATGLSQRAAVELASAIIFIHHKYDDRYPETVRFLSQWTKVSHDDQNYVIFEDIGRKTYGGGGMTSGAGVRLYVVRDGQFRDIDLSGEFYIHGQVWSITYEDKDRVWIASRLGHRGSGKVLVNLVTGKVEQRLDNLGFGDGGTYKPSEDLSNR
jgi:hypothetical protein